MPTIGNLGTMFVRGENKKLVPVPCIQGKNGITPHIGENGNWWIGDTDTGAMADNKKYPVSASVYEKIITGKPSEYTLEILLKDGERIRAELPNMGLTPDDVVEIGIGEPSEFDDINYKQFYLDKNTGRLYINTSKMYPNSYITIGGVVLSGENDPTGGEAAYINNLYINTTTGAIFLCVRMESFMPSEPPHPVWQQIGGTGVDVGTDITLGITRAVVGQTAKITEVDENGKPVKWGSADIPAQTDIDSTLSIEGSAADAKVVGDKLAEVSGAIAELGGTLVEPAEDDIPKVFFGGALQQTKDVAVVPFRYISKTQDISGYAEIKAQGNSSMSYPKKNQTVKMFKDADCTEKMKVDFKGWGAQNKHCYKANWIDLTHARNIVSARLWADVVKSRANYAELPELLRTSPNQGAVDGFPIKVYANGVYQGRYTLNIPKDKWMANMDDTLDTNCILCGEGYVSGCFREASVSQWTDEIHYSMPDTIKNRWIEVINFVMSSTNEEFKANLGNYFDISSLIDYHIYGLVSCGLDAYGKNQLYLTYDGQKWIASMYDMDSTWGLYFTGSILSPDYARESYEDMKQEGNLLYIRLEQLFYEELQTRWVELKKGALSIENIINRFERFTDIAPAELVKEDYATTTGGGAFTGIPSQSTNNIQQIRSFALERQVWTDEYIAGLTPVVPVPCTGITLSAETLTFMEKEAQTLTAIVTPDGCTDVVVWESSNAEIATVTNGVVTPVASGNCTITAICGEYSATCAVSVDIETETPVVLPDGAAYSMTSEQTFNGASDYVDTGVMLFDTAKDFTVFIDFTPVKIEKANINIFNCQREASPYPGLSVVTKVDSIAGYMKYSVAGKFLDINSNTADGSVRYKLCLARNSTDKTLAIKLYSDGQAITETSTAFNPTKTFEQNALIGAYQTTDGTKGRFWTGTIHNCGIWEKLLTDEEITNLLTRVS